MDKWFELSVSLTDPESGVTRTHIERVDDVEINAARRVMQKYLSSQASSSPTVISFTEFTKDEVSLAPEKAAACTIADRWNGIAGYWTDYPKFALLHGNKALSEKLTKLYGQRPGWGNDMDKALVEGLGIKKCVGYVFRTRNVNLAYHLLQVSRGQLNQREHTIVSLAVLGESLTKSAVIGFRQKYARSPKRKKKAK